MQIQVYGGQLTLMTKKLLECMMIDILSALTIMGEHFLTTQVLMVKFVSAMQIAPHTGAIMVLSNWGCIEPIGLSRSLRNGFTCC